MSRIELVTVQKGSVIPISNRISLIQWINRATDEPAREWERLAISCHAACKDYIWGHAVLQWLPKGLLDEVLDIRARKVCDLASALISGMDNKFIAQRVRVLGQTWRHAKERMQPKYLPNKDIGLTSYDHAVMVKDLCVKITYAIAEMESTINSVPDYKATTAEQTDWWRPTLRDDLDSDIDLANLRQIQARPDRVLTRPSWRT